MILLTIGGCLFGLLIIVGAVVSMCTDDDLVFYPFLVLGLFAFAVFCVSSVIFSDVSVPEDWDTTVETYQLETIDDLVLRMEQKDGLYGEYNCVSVYYNGSFHNYDQNNITIQKGDVNQIRIETQKAREGTKTALFNGNPVRETVTITVTD